MTTEEQLAVFDLDGREIGATSRSVAYARGDRVGLVFVWIAWPAQDGGVRMLLQSRARPGDRYEGSLDAPAGGHVAVGEGPLAAAARELFEETGLRADTAELRLVDRTTLELDAPGETRLRAVQWSYLWIERVPLLDLHLGEEVDAFVETDLAELSDLLAGGRGWSDGLVRYAHSPSEVSRLAVQPAAFSAYPPPVLAIIRRSLACVVREVTRSLSAAGHPPSGRTP